MTWVDLAIVGLLLISGLLAFVRGFVREVLGIGAWVGAGAIAMYALSTTRGIVRNWINSPAWVDPAAFLLGFLVSLVVLMIIARIIGGLVRASILGGVDRTLGLVFGIARGAVIVVLAYILGGMVFPIDRWPPAVLNARSLWPVYTGAVWARSQLPEEYRPRIYAPPSDSITTADDLLRATPQGRATGKAPAKD